MKDKLELLANVAQLRPDITLGEYFKTYSPTNSANECCVLCRKSGAAKCEWDYNLSEVPGWIADVEYNRFGKVENARIYYCPKFEPDNTPKETDLDGCMRLLVAFAGEVGKEYREILQSATERRRVLKSWDEHDSAYAVLAKNYYKLLIEKKHLENILESHYRKIQRRVGYTPDDEFDESIRKIVERRVKRDVK